MGGVGRGTAGAGLPLAELLRRLPPGPGRELLVDPVTGEILYRGGPRLETAHPVGSLVKPFSLMARASRTPLPERRLRLCRPSPATRSPYASCWYRPGHGLLDLPSALANSCNHWFTSFFHEEDWTPARALWERLRFEVHDPGRGRRRREALIGGAAAVRGDLELVAAAYGALCNGGILFAVAPRRGRILATIEWPPDLERLHLGLRQVCVSGTAHCAQDWAGTLPLAGKTGTAAGLTAEGKESWRHGNGWFVGWTPPRNPSLLAVVFLEDGRGREAALRGGRLLAAAWELKGEGRP